MLDPVEAVYQALESVETGGLAGSAKYIRANDKYVGKEGSTAYGPVQITRRKLEDARRLDLNPGERAFLQNVLIPQAEKFRKFGREESLEGYHPKYDYSGKGRGSGAGDYSEATRELYETYYPRIAKKLIASDISRYGGDIDRAIKVWHGSKDPNANQRYLKRVRSFMDGK